MTDRAKVQTAPPAGSFLRRLFRSLGIALGVLVLVIAVVVVFAIPIELDWIKGKIEDGAGEALGRPFAIEGPLTLIPSIPPAAQIEGVRIGNPPGWPEGDLAKLGLARVQLRILPLLRGEILIEEIAVDGLHLNLVTNAQGDPNWLLGDPDAKPTEEEQEAAPTGQPKALAFIELAELALTDIVLSHRD